MWQALPPLVSQELRVWPELQVPQRLEPQEHMVPQEQLVVPQPRVSQEWQAL